MLYATLVIFFLVFLLRAALRRTWLAGAIVVLLADGFVRLIGFPWMTVGLTTLMFSGAVAILIRCGVLPMVTALFVDVGLMRGSPLTTDLTAWYARSMLIAVTIVLALTFWCFKYALGGRKVFKGDFLEG